MLGIDMVDIVVVGIDVAGIVVEGSLWGSMWWT